MTIKLTDAQLVMLSAAAQREDLCLTAPDKMKGAILAKVTEKLVKLGLVREVRAKAGAPVWRRDDAGQSYALKLIGTGLKAIAVDDGSDEATASKETPQLQPNPRASKTSGPDIVGERGKTLTPRAGSKLAQVIDLLQRSEGATILDLIEATGWLPHTTRATLTGLRKRGYAVIRERVDGGDFGLPNRCHHCGGRRSRSRRTPSVRGRRPRVRAKGEPGGLIGHASQANRVQTGGEGFGVVFTARFAATRYFSALHSGGPRGSRPQWVAPPMARPFGRRASCPSPPLAIDESAGPFRLQADAFGGLDKSIQRMLRPNGEHEGATPFDRRPPQTRDGVGLKAGALLVREWNGKLERVMVLEKGFAWNGADLRQPVPDRQGDEPGRTGTVIASSVFDRERPLRRTKQANAERGGQGSQRPPRRMQRREMRREGSVGQGASCAARSIPGSRPIRGSNRTSTPSTPNGRLPRPTSRV